MPGMGRYTYISNLFLELAQLLFGPEITKMRQLGSTYTRRRQHCPEDRAIHKIMLCDFLSTVRIYLTSIKYTQSLYAHRYIKRACRS